MVCGDKLNFNSSHTHQSKAIIPRSGPQARKWNKQSQKPTPDQTAPREVRRTERIKLVRKWIMCTAHRLHRTKLGPLVLQDVQLWAFGAFRECSCCYCWWKSTNLDWDLNHRAQRFRLLVIRDAGMMICKFAAGSFWFCAALFKCWVNC